jgi:DNA-binding CsgD family transcriptional regulator
MTVTEVSDRLYGAPIKRAEPVRLQELAAPDGRTEMLRTEMLRTEILRPEMLRTGMPPLSGMPHRLRWLVGRSQELAVIRAFVDDLAAHGRAMLLSGEPGVGKSALLDVAEETAATAGIRVLRAAGAESEHVSFDGLNQLLLPLSGDLDRLDDQQRNVLNVALGFSAGLAGDRLLVSNAVLALLLRAAADGPLLLIVDDLDRMDQASALALGFVARRLRGSRVGLIAAVRTGASSASALDVPSFALRPLDDDASARLVASRFPGLAAEVRQRIVAEARGNSLALLELPAGLTDQQRSGLAALPAVLPLTARLAAHLRDQPQRRAWHLAGAAIEPDGGAAGSLPPAPRKQQQQYQYQRYQQQERQQQERQHGAVARRAEPIGAAAHGAMVGRLATAAYLAASVLGDLSAAEALLAEARRACPGARMSAEMALATAFVLLHSDGDVAAAARLLPRGMETTLDGGAGPLGRKQALQIAATISRLSGRPVDLAVGRPANHVPDRAADRLAVGPADHAPDRPADCAPDRPAVRAADCGAPEPRAQAGWAGAEIASLADQAEPAQIVRIAHAAIPADRLSDCRQALRLVARSEPDGTPAMQAGILLALEAYQTGQWDEAWRLAETVAELCASRGYQLLRRQAQTVLALVAACRGDAERVRALTDEITRWAAPRGIASLLAGARYADGLAALAQSDFRTAYDQAAAISPTVDITAREPCAAWALLDLVEAALHTDRQGEAVAHAQAGLQAGLAAVSPRLALLSTAALAMTAPDEEAPALFDQALAGEGAQRWPFDRARVQLLYGERLRRVRAMTAARAQLSAAVDEFRRLGARTWADRAATALRATGQVRQRPDSHDYQELTPQELQIARFAAAGLSNKQIGERLYMSHRTVGSHLYRIFPKLGITSRAALSGALPREAD